MSILDALARMEVLPKWLGQQEWAKLVDPQRVLAPMHEAAARLAEGVVSTTNPSPPCDPQRAWIRLRDAGYDLAALSEIEARSLCLSVETATLPDVIGALSRSEILPRRKFWIAGLIAAYFGKWREMERPEEVEELLCRVLGLYKGRNRSLLGYRDRRDRLFSARAPAALAKEMVGDRRETIDFLQNLEIPATSGLGLAVADSAIQAWRYEFRVAEYGCSEREALDRLEYLLTKLLCSPNVRAEVFAGGVTECVLSGWADRSKEFRKHSLRFIHDSPRLGDPRLPANRANWTAVDTKVKQTVLSWLAHDALLFFFEQVLPDRSEVAERKKFWLQYVGRVSDFRVALSTEDRTRLRAEAGKLPQFSQTDHAKTSAFLMRFRGQSDMVVVEFSQSGNAAYLYDAKVFEDRVGTFHRPRFGIDSELKHRDKVGRILHVPRGGWQDKARKQMATYGIRP